MDIGNFFGSIYCGLGLDQLYGLELANYLWGQSSHLQTANMFIGIGLSMLCISLLMVVCFYYVINHPRLNTWWGWLIFLGINAIVNFFVGWQWVLDDYYAGLMVEISPITGQEVDLNIFPENILTFGVVNMVLAILAFIIISYILKWWSTNCSRAPF